MIISAKFASTCPCCSGQIRVGDRVEWSRGSRARHAACSGSTGTVRQVGTARRSYGRSSRYASGAGSAAPVAGYSSWCSAREGCGCYDCAS